MAPDVRLSAEDVPALRRAQQETVLRAERYDALLEAVPDQEAGR